MAFAFKRNICNVQKTSLKIGFFCKKTYLILQEFHQHRHIIASPNKICQLSLISGSD
jgi:hypothetical protein